MSDLALLGLFVPLGAFILAGLWITVALLVDDSVRKEIGQ